MLNMVTKNIDHFNLRKIMNSGQIFRMYEPEDGRFVVYSGNRRLEIRQEIPEGYKDKSTPFGDLKTVFYCTQKEFEEYWESYFDLKRDYGEIVRAAGKYHETVNSSGAGFLMRACEYGSDIRVLKQDIWEMMISFIISQQKQISSIRKCIEALCERFGERHVNSLRDSSNGYPGDGNCVIHDDAIETNGKATHEDDIWYGFPSAEAIAAAGPDGVKGLSLGYRERYIYETAVKYVTDGISDTELMQMTYEEVKKYLCSYPGIGEKVADCVCLFGVGLVDAFPIDVHIKDILYREFVSEKRKEELETVLKNKQLMSQNTVDIPRKKILDSISYGDYMKLINENFSCFNGVKGIVQQWIFAYEISKQ